MTRLTLDFRSPRVQAGAAATAAAATVLLLVATIVRMHSAPAHDRHTLPAAAPAAIAPAPPPAGAPLAIGRPPPLEFQALTPQQAQAINAATPFAAEPIRPARPFTLKGASELDRARAERCLTQAVYYEAGFEPLQGRRAVAQVVLNRLRHPIFPKTICGVVYEGSEKPTGCQFTFTCDGALLRPPAPAAWAEAQKVAHAALNGAVEPSVGWATHYHTAFVVPYWMPTLTKLTRVGAHIFYRWPQGMGLPTAFTGAYAGGEAPIPGDPPETADDAVAALLAAASAGADSAPDAAAAAPLAVPPNVDGPSPAATATSAPAPAVAPTPAAAASPPRPRRPTGSARVTPASSASAPGRRAALRTLMADADGFHFYEPAQGHGLPHDPFNAIVAPRPIGWIGTVDGEGRRNLAPYSFFNAFNYHPPIVGFASVGWKDSVANVEATGVFTWSLVTRPQAEAMNATSATVGPEVDEFALAGFAPAPSRVIAAPGVVGSPVVFECRRTQTLRLADAGGREVDTWLVLGEVVGVHIARAALKDGVFDTAGVRPVLRGGGAADYFEIGPDARFAMRRPA